jgi:hypothetical protein
MSIPCKPEPALAVLSILSSSWDRFWPALLDELEACLGPADEITGLFDFLETSYYDQELGTPIQRRMLSFKELVDPSRLAEIKLFTNRMEKAHAWGSGRRLFNLDPGLLSLERLVLATGKNYTHRIYLRHGIWADLTLIYQHKGWLTLPWTFPDYGGQVMQEILSRFRESYKKRLQEKRAGAAG